MDVNAMPMGLCVHGMYVGGQSREKDGKLKGFVLVSVGTDALKVWLSDTGLARLGTLPLAIGDEIWMTCRPWAGDKGGLMYTQGDFVI